MIISTVPWAAVLPYAQVVGPTNAPVTVLPFPHPLATARALRDASGAVRVIGIDPTAPVRVLVPDLGDALVLLKQAGFDFRFVSEFEQ